MYLADYTQSYDLRKVQVMCTNPVNGTYMNGTFVVYSVKETPQ